MYDIAFKGTKEHANADGLSRLPVEEDGQEISVMATEASIFNIAQIEGLPIRSIYKNSVLSSFDIHTARLANPFNAVNMNSLLKQVVCCGESE